MKCHFLWFGPWFHCYKSLTLCIAFCAVSAAVFVEDFADCTPTRSTPCHVNIMFSSRCELEHVCHQPLLSQNQGALSHCVPTEDLWGPKSWRSFPFRSKVMKFFFWISLLPGKVGLVAYNPGTKASQWFLCLSTCIYT